MDKKALITFEKNMDRLSNQVLGLDVVDTFLNPADAFKFLSDKFSDKLSPDRAFDLMQTEASVCSFSEVLFTRADNKAIKVTKVVLDGSKMTLNTTFEVQLAGGTTVNVMSYDSSFCSDYSESYKFSLMALCGDDDNDYYENSVILDCYKKAISFISEFPMVNAGDYHFNHVVQKYQEDKNLLTVLGSLMTLMGRI